MGNGMNMNKGFDIRLFDIENTGSQYTTMAADQDEV
jgi:hypothetical protein